MRKHGWQLPYHPLQVVATAVFLALAFAFYVFFVPFVGSRILELYVIVVYSPVVMAAFVLFIWCAAVNPADPGVLGSRKYRASPVSRKESATLGKSSERDASENATSAELPATDQLSAKHKIEAHGSFADDGSRKCHPSCSTALVSLPGGAFFGNLFNESKDEFISEDDMLYCSLCEVKIFKYSKHCRVCDKCVDGFDHHCRWLNNCIGKKNYRWFITLMISAMSMLILQSAVGLWVVVRCFLDRRRFQYDIVSKLGSSFSLIPYVIVVMVCTSLAIIATFPLGQLFCFHVLLIKKGISTYDYIVAMREQEHQLHTGEGIHSPLTSPASSGATVLSGGSSVGGLQRGSWCTPPRLFLDQKQSVLRPDRDFSSSELERGTATKPVEEHPKKKAPVKLSTFALARLNTEDAVRAAAQARSRSSILRPVVQKEAMMVAETDSSFDSSSRDVSAEIALPVGSRRAIRRPDAPISLVRDRLTLMRSCRQGKFPVLSLEQTDYSGNSMNVGQPIDGESAMPTPLQLEARSAFCPSTTLYPVGLSTSSPESVASPEAQSNRETQLGMQDLLNLSVALAEQPCLKRSASDGYEASGGESADDSDRAGMPGYLWSKLKPHPNYGNKGDMRHFIERRVSGLGEIHASQINFKPGRSNKLGKVIGLGREAGITEPWQAHPDTIMQEEEPKSVVLNISSPGKDSDFLDILKSAPKGMVHLTSSTAERVGSPFMSKSASADCSSSPVLGHSTSA
eukprot:c21145_g1_i1 orf=710-2932(-)